MFFNKKYWRIWDIDIRNFNETLTNDVVSFEQPGPVVQSSVSLMKLLVEGLLRLAKLTKLIALIYFAENL